MRVASETLRHVVLLVAVLLCPVTNRAVLLIERRLSLDRFDLRGVLSDLAVSLAFVCLVWLAARAL